MFRKNKIQSQIDNNTIAFNSEDFDSLDIVKKKLKSKKLFNRLIVTPTQLMIKDIQHKYKQTTKYLMKHLPFIFTWSFYAVLFTTFVVLNVLAFMPFYGANVNETWTTVNNFWMAQLNDNQITYLLTPLAWSFFALLALSLTVFIFYYRYTKKINVKWIDRNNRKNTVLSYCSYLMLFVGLCLLLITLLIPPAHLYSEQAITTAFTYIRNYDVASDLDKTRLFYEVKAVYEYFGYSMPDVTTSVELIAKFNIHSSDGLFLASPSIANYWFFADVYRATLSGLSTIGIIITSFYAVALFIGAFLLPLIITYQNVSEYYHEHEKANKLWNIWNVFVYWLMRVLNFHCIYKFKLWKCAHKIKHAEKKAAHKSKATYAKFKKQNKEDGRTSSEEAFNSNQLDNAAFSMLTKETIEAHEANKAFLNVDGDWMYHDGASNYYIAKNDTWIKYDLTKAIHKVHVDANAKLNLDPSKKQFKEGRFKKAKQKKSTPIALPDDDLDDILKKLDI